jgi:lysophospholipase L1-like esterase
MVGKEINVYFDNLIYGDARRYDFVVKTSLGKHENERWTAVPTETGDYSLSIEVYDEYGAQLSAADTTVRVADQASNANTHRKVIFIGDSTTGAGHYTAELLRLFAVDSMNLELAGTKGEGLNAHEGRGGWRSDQYFNSEESPFVVDGRMDIKQYLLKNEYTGITDVCIHLGINDIYHAETHGGIQHIIEQRFPMLDEIIAQFKSYDSNIRIGMMPCIPPSRDQDSFGANYGTNQNRRTYRRKLQLWNTEILRRYANRQAEGIEIIPIYVNLDTVNNMPAHMVPANSRSSRTIRRQNNGVHPLPEGYFQMADVIYYWLKQSGGNGA